MSLTSANCRSDAKDLSSGSRRGLLGVDDSLSQNGDGTKGRRLTLRFESGYILTSSPQLILAPAGPHTPRILQFVGTRLRNDSPQALLSIQ
jgi:hypothetical protein